jgi:hypothetical protein
LDEAVQVEEKEKYKIDTMRSKDILELCPQERLFVSARLSNQSKWRFVSRKALCRFLFVLLLFEGTLQRHH